MTLFSSIHYEIRNRKTNFIYKNNWQRLHLDPFLLSWLILLAVIGAFILYSTTQDSTVLFKQMIRLSIAFSALLAFAQIPEQRYRSWTPWLYLLGVGLLLLVLLSGTVGKGAQRWLEFGIFHFQPSELMKLIVPMMLAWYLSQQQLPPTKRSLLLASCLTLLPGLFIIKQPDLGTAIMVLMAGGAVIIFAGISARLLFTSATVFLTSIPILWHYMHTYQKERVLTFLNPERDPLGSGYHIIQSKIAIGSGGLFGKGWFNSSQSQLNFLPEHATDFIFSAFAEEFGLIGCLLLLLIYTVIIVRIFQMAMQAKGNFSRLLISSIGLTFFAAIFVNIGMVTGLLPVVGLPLPLVSYGGTSTVTWFISFGILMSLHSNRKFLPSCV